MEEGKLKTRWTSKHGTEVEFYASSRVKFNDAILAFAIEDCGVVGAVDGLVVLLRELAESEHRDGDAAAVDDGQRQQQLHSSTNKMEDFRISAK